MSAIRQLPDKRYNADAEAGSPAYHNNLGSGFELTLLKRSTKTERNTGGCCVAAVRHSDDFATLGKSTPIGQTMNHL